MRVRGDQVIPLAFVVERERIFGEETVGDEEAI